MTEAPGLTGPDCITIRRTTPRGPFAQRGTTMVLGKEHVALVNNAAAPLTLESPTANPLRDDATGLAAPGEITVTAAPNSLPPGGAAACTLEGTIPARPGKFCGTLRIGADYACPIILEVAAAPRWGILCMVTGLFVLGGLNLLADAGANETALHDALKARQDIYTTLEHTPAPQSRAAEIDGMDHDFAKALAILSERRAATLIDHRQFEAQPLLASAEKTASALSAELAAEPPGTAEIKDLDQAWKNLQDVVRTLANLPQQLPDTPQQSFAHSLDAFLVAFRTRIVRAPAAALLTDIATGLGNVTLHQSAGEFDTARALAVNTRLWLERSALTLSRALTLYRTAVVKAGWMVTTEAILRDRAGELDIPPEARPEIIARLDAAAAKLAGTPSLTDWRDANKMIDETLTSETRVAAAQLKRQVDAAIAEADRQTNHDDVNALLARLSQAPLPHTLAMKQAGLSEALALWRAHAQTVAYPGTQASFLRQIAAMESLIDAGKLQDISAPIRTFMSDWVKYSSTLAEAGIDRVNHAYCLNYGADIERNRAAVEMELRQLPASPRLNAWDAQLDKVRLDLQREGPDAVAIGHSCLDSLVRIGKEVNDLSAAVFTDNLADTHLPAASRLRLAQESGIAAAAALMQNNIASPRTLSLEVQTPEEDRVTGRTLRFFLRGDDPAWASATQITVEYGDSSKPLIATAEALRKTVRIEHEYSAPIAARLTLRAALPGTSPQQAPTILGTGQTSILIRPSPIGKAQAIADEFISLRFAFALILAGIIYQWRYQAHTSIFGARSFDYVEAFALGFAVDAAVSDLPSALARFVPVG